MDTLFHYCSSSTFASIVSRRSIWLSSLSLSNDTMEGRLVTQTFERLLSQSTIQAEEIEEIRDALRFAEELFDGLGFCLSEKPDLLSQWRGYADDGQGFSIGFTKAYLEELAKAREDGESGFRLGKVLYEPTEHEAALKPTYDEIKKIIDSGILKRPRFGLITMPDEQEMKKRQEEYAESIKALWRKTVGGTVLSAHMLKNRAFVEEAEWRLVSYLVKESNDSASFRAAGNRLVPYREFNLKQLTAKPITEVYLGPKNITPNFVIEKFLTLNGFPDVSVKRSAATYR